MLLLNSLRYRLTVSFALPENGFRISASVLPPSNSDLILSLSEDTPPDVPFALTSSFFEDSVKKVQWKAFVRKKKIKMDNVELSDIVHVIKDFLMPPLTALQQDNTFNMTWKPFGPWQLSAGGA